MKKLFLLFVISFLLTGCPSDELGDNSLCIKNYSGTQMYFWFSYDFTQNHFPETLLPVEKPVSIRGAGSGGCIWATIGHNPTWEGVYLQLPEDKFSVYFFETYPETQEDWDILRNNSELVHKKDVTFEELKNNNYVIEYP